MREAQERTPNARKQRPLRPPVTSRPHIRASLKSRGRARAAGRRAACPQPDPNGLPTSPQGSRGTCAPLSPSHRKRVRVLLRIPLRPTEGVRPSAGERKKPETALLLPRPRHAHTYTKEVFTHLTRQLRIDLHLPIKPFSKTRTSEKLNETRRHGREAETRTDSEPTPREPGVGPHLSAQDGGHLTVTQKAARARPALWELASGVKSDRMLRRTATGVSQNPLRHRRSTLTTQPGLSSQTWSGPVT